MRRAMVVVQVALSLVLLSSGGLVARSFDRLLATHPGFDPRGVLTLRVSLPESLYPDSAAVVAAHARIHRELAAIPGVKAAGAGSAIPLTHEADQTRIVLPGAPGNTGEENHDTPLVDYVAVRPGYFQAMGIRVLGGRLFGAEPRGEVVIDRVLAEQFFPSGSPVGATLMFGDDSMRVAGVVEHARQYDVHRDGRPQVYLRHEGLVFRSLSFAVRSDRDPAGMAADIRDAVARVDARLAISRLRPMDEVVGDAIRQQRVSAVLIGGFSLGALLLAAMGLYGVVSGAVSRRRHELAVRLALGADHARVLRLVLREGAVLILLGVLVGAPGIYLAGRAIRGVLVGVSPFDPPTLAAVTCGLAMVALAACYLPARRVVRIEPARSLRQE
jgi:predicted permease